MAFTVTKSAGNYNPPPPGMHIARCYQLVDLGTQQKLFNKKIIGQGRKIRLTWELLGEDKMDDGRPFSISRTYFMSLHEKSSMRKDLESWRGRAFTAEEEKQFDVSRLIGGYCMLNVVEEPGADGDTFTKIAAVTQMPKGLPKPEAINDTLIWDLESPDMEVYEGFSDHLKEIIGESPEWQARGRAAKPAPAVSAAAKPAAKPVSTRTEPSGEFDDEMPF